MAAANESQGLKIAVAAFVSLTVILAVVVYFLYSNYDQTAAKLAAAEQTAREKSNAASLALTQYEDLKKRIGSRAEEYDAVKTEIKNESDKIDDDIAAMPNQVNEARRQGPGLGGQRPGPAGRPLPGSTGRQRLPERAEQELPRRDRPAQGPAQDQVMLTTALSKNYLDVKRNLESTDDVAAKKLDVETQALNDAKADLEAEQKKHVQEREVLLTKVDQLQTENAKQATEIATLNTRARQLKEDSDKKLALAQQTIRDLRDEKERKETVLDRPDGEVTYVDYGRGEVYTNITYGMGARPQMVMSIFDAASPGIPTEKPKGNDRADLRGRPLQHRPDRQDGQHDRPDPGRRHRLLAGLVAQRADAVRPDRQDRHQPRRQGRPCRPEADDRGGRRDRRLRPPPPEAGKEIGQAHRARRLVHLR